MTDYPDLAALPRRLLLGPGPANVDPRVIKAMTTPLLGHLDPDFLGVMDRIRELLQFVYQTQNELTFPLPGTGSAGLEAALCNLIEDGDQVLVGVNGYFGERLYEVAGRCRAEVRRLELPYGQVFQPEQVDEALSERPASIVAMVHAETSGGTLQPVREIAEVVHRRGALLVLDAVTSLGGLPVEVDAWGVDACYSCSQKCLGCPPGLAPITLSSRAVDRLHARSRKVQDWYLDLTLLEKYWGDQRMYHHTAPISMNYAFYEALRIVHEEGLVARFARHQRNARALWAGLEAMGIELLVPAEHRLPTVSAVSIPEGVPDGRVRGRLLKEFDIEIGGGLGQLRGKVWRVGLMGYSSSGQNVLQFLGALERVLRDEGYSLSPGAGIVAAQETLE
jgi:alanine-glyoxylate transaminase/serine-glyoxylate transaminase/serine-pyruvate transaminase